MKIFILLLVLGCTLSACAQSQHNTAELQGKDSLKKVQAMNKINKSEEEWRKELTPEQYQVLREKGTERAFTGKYWDHKDTGEYVCAGCGAVLFESDTKFDAGCGWPSFYQAKNGEAIEEHEDNSWGMHRTEVLCAKCGGHLGHLFDDGPNPTGLRYCINSASIDFKKKAGDSSQTNASK